jgi:Putative DNA-binding domain
VDREISAEISALANTEGGELFLGIDEDRKSRPRVATSIDGSPAALAPERLQQLIESHVSPYLPGIRVHRVLLSNQPTRAVFVVRIPQGSTANQANDGRYYGRSEFEAKYLPDHEVRLRMSRGKVARSIIIARVVAVDLGLARESRIRAEAEAKRAELSGRTGEPIELEVERRNPDGTPVFYNPHEVLKLLSAQLLPDVVNLDFVFRNDGELTVRAPALEFRESRNKRLFDEGLVRVIKSVPMRFQLEDPIIYPGDELAINDARLSLECKRETVLATGDYTLSWKVFLDNSPPSLGEIDLASLIETARRQGAGDR